MGTTQGSDYKLIIHQHLYLLPEIQLVRFLIRKTSAGWQQSYKMVERRRKPLVLRSTKHVLNSLLGSSTSPTNKDEPSPPNFQLPVGILRFSNQTQSPSLDHSALLGLSTSLLKTLSITSGSPVIILKTQIKYPFIKKINFSPTSR